MVECECYCGKTRIFEREVLIDTWWNVNMINNDAWISAEIGFNRYMVECEYIAGFGFLKRVSRFNRYMVECEYVGFAGKRLLGRWF